MDKDLPDLETALQLVKVTLNNQKFILGTKKPEVKKVHFEEDDIDNDPSLSNEFEIQLSDEIAGLRSGLEAINAKVDKIVVLLNKQVIAKPKSTTRKTDSN